MGEIKAFIVSIDSDLLGLEGIHYNWNKDVWITKTKEEEQYKFWSDMICGTHNNTKGIPGSGIKTSEKILSSVEKEDYVSEVLIYYISYFGEQEGIKQFYSNYMCNKLLTHYEGFIIPEPIMINKQVW